MTSVWGLLRRLALPRQHMEFVTTGFCIRINTDAHTWIIPDYL